LSDLILVTGCDKTSEWACAAWSEKTLRLSFLAGAPGMAGCSASLWGRWETTESLDKNVGPQPLVPAHSGVDTTPQVTSQLSEGLLTEETTSMPSRSRNSPSARTHFNQCVFVRGFQIADRITWFKRRKIRIDVGSGFMTVRRPLDPKRKENKDLMAQGGSGGSQQQLGTSSTNVTSHLGTQSVDSASWHRPHDDGTSDSDDGSLTDAYEVGFFTVVAPSRLQC